MKVSDRFGNELQAGDSVAWMPATPVNLIALIQRCIPPKTGSDAAPGVIVFQVEMRITTTSPDANDFFVGDLVKTFDPRANQMSGVSSPLLQ